ncbi:MAG: permease-like cell division protein FtsX [Bacteroidota bacterium]|nr:permease-like cell division protein FtsX [Bacteroidota bacterium]
MKSTNYDNINKNRLRSNLFSIFIIISSVLFLLGLLSLIFVKTNSIGNYFKEQVVIGIYFQENTNDIQIKQLEKLLTLNQSLVSIKYISKADAVEIFTQEIGEDFTTFLGFNPLLSSLNINYKGEEFDTESVDNFILNLKNNYDFIESVEYDKPLIDLLNSNFNKIGMWVITLGIVFLIICYLLINNSIRLSIYSKRHIIKTMQLVGATKRFIRLPFIITYFKLGLLSSFFSISLLFILIYQINIRFQELELLKDSSDIIMVLVFTLMFGILASVISSYLVTQKYLNLKTSEQL